MYYLHNDCITTVLHTEKSNHMGAEQLWHVKLSMTVIELADHMHNVHTSHIHSIINRKFNKN